MTREVPGRRPVGSWKPLRNMRAAPAMFALSDMMLRRDIANPGRLPYLGRAEKLLVITDIAGTKRDPYEVYSFLITGRGMMNPFLQTALELRKTLPDQRRISYKRLNSDKVVGRIIKPFLDAADEIPGFLLCVAIDSRIESLNAEFLRELAPRLKWKPRTLERAMRVITYIGLLLSGFARPGQSVFWLSDEDPMIANSRMIEHLQIIIPPLWRSVLSFDLPFAHFADTRISNRDILAEDVVSVVDVAAGATLEQLRNGINATFPLNGRSIPAMQWLCNESSKLVKQVLLIRSAPDGSGLVHTWPTFKVHPPSGSRVTDG